MEESISQGMSFIKRIALLGPESTGKTQLCIQLAAHFKTEWVPEYARQYLKDNNYSYSDVLHCFDEQLKLEEKNEKNANQLLFCDTELINYKVWFSDVFNKVPEDLEQKIKTHTYDLTLLTYHDIPFEEDILRVNSHRREFFFNWYKNELEAYQKPYAIIKGLGQERLMQAITAVNKLIN
jgi:NadR type nicotinamide-nucleotide adenylyltransferase